MAFLLLDSFDHYAITDVTRKWTQIYGGVDAAVHAIVTGGGRRSTNAFRTRNNGIAANLPGCLARMLTPVGSTTCFTGFAFKASPQSGATASWGGLITPAGGANSLNQAAANSGTGDSAVNVLAAVRHETYTHVAISINTNGTISAYRGTNAVAFPGTGRDRIAATLGTSVRALQFDQYHYIELRVVISETVGEVQVVVDGDTWLNLSGIDTLADGSSVTGAWSEIAVAGLRCEESIEWYVDDFYVGDPDLSDANNQMAGLVGDLRIDYRNVFVDGTHTGWTPLSGVLHYDMVDDNPPDLDTTYNSTLTLNALDTFLKSAVPVVGATVIAMQPIYLRRRTEGGNTSTAAVVLDAGTAYTGSKEGTSTAEGDPSTYVYNWWDLTQRPSASGTALTQATVDAMEIGYKKIS